MRYLRFVDIILNLKRRKDKLNANKGDFYDELTIIAIECGVDDGLVITVRCDGTSTVEGTGSEQTLADSTWGEQVLRSDWSLIEHGIFPCVLCSTLFLSALFDLTDEVLEDTSFREEDVRIALAVSLMFPQLEAMVLVDVRDSFDSACLISWIDDWRSRGGKDNSEFIISTWLILGDDSMLHEDEESLSFKLTEKFEGVILKNSFYNHRMYGSIWNHMIFKINFPILRWARAK
jgi:hypothetical protein